MTVLDINSDSEINKRLLKAFSVEALKEVFNLTDSKERQAGLLSNIIKSNNATIINNTVFKHFSLLKQHVYLYEFKGALDDNWLDKHPSFLSMQKMTNSHSIFNLLIPVKYEGYNKTKGSMEEFEFVVPVQIHKKKTVLIIHINILERDISTITTDKIFSPKRDINDENILANIIPFANPVTLFKYDLNRGIKQLWHIDEVDAIKIKYKKAKSTSQEVMDEVNSGIKKEMPLIYAELIKTPLRHATFRILKQKNLINFFVVDPSSGIFNFSVFPQHLNGINDLIDLVLTKN
jgi:hypothetical protein